MICPVHIKSVYVKHLPKNVTQDQLKKLFEHHGKITKVVLPTAKSGQENRIGFMHFAERASAMKALTNTEKHEIDGENSPPCFVMHHSSLTYRFIDSVFIFFFRP